LKIFLFRNEFKLNTEEVNGVRDMQDVVRRKQPEMWTALSIIQFLAKPPYPPDLSPPDPFLFPKTQLTLKGTRL
jgi:hypothetical protein